MATNLSAVRECALTLERIDTHSHVEATFPASGGGSARASRHDGDGARIDRGARDGGGVPCVVRHRPRRLLDAGGPGGALCAGGGVTGRRGITRLHGGAGYRAHHPAVRLHRLLRVSAASGGALPFARLLPAYRLAGLSRPVYYRRATTWLSPRKAGSRTSISIAACASFLGPLPDLDAYLAAMDAAIDGWRQYGVVGMKIGLAYTTGARFHRAHPGGGACGVCPRRSDAPDGTHGTAFCRASRTRRLPAPPFPVVIHTGYLIWGQGDLRQAIPCCFTHCSSMRVIGS